MITADSFGEVMFSSNKRPGLDLEDKTPLLKYPSSGCTRKRRGETKESL